MIATPALASNKPFDSANTPLSRRIGIRPVAPDSPVWRSLMFPATWKTFIHPNKVYRLEYPSHWDQVQQDEARSCGFGPHDRDDVGLWISIMPVSLDTEKLANDLPRL